VNILSTNIPDLRVVETNLHTDVRGAFARLYCAQELTQLVDHRPIVQINHSRTAAVGTVRGLHFQYPPHAEMKLVRCIKGRVWDVAIDLRQRSPTFLRWHAIELTPTNTRMMVIPEGFAHGFQVIEPDSELLYLHTEFYAPHAEGGLRFDDPLLGITWPLTVSDLSERDSSHPYIDSNFQGLTL
jgi:dTDP-4-dehydrorhamnose 3,5-epimerase